jgi:hypothetical protein
MAATNNSPHGIAHNTVIVLFITDVFLTIGLLGTLLARATTRLARRASVPRRHH